MKLFGYWRSTAAYRVRIALNLKGIEVEHRSVHLVKGGGEQHQEDYRSMNPEGLVPLLVDGDAQISQSLAIIHYLERTHPEPSLLSSDPLLSAQIESVAQSICCDIHPLNNLRVLQYLSREWGVSDDDKQAWYAHWIEQGFTALETRLASQPESRFCFSDKPTLADVCLVPQVYNANRFHCPMDAYPRIQAINAACLELDAFDDARPEVQPDAG